MTHYLRYEDCTIVDVETGESDIHCVVDIREFTNALMRILGTNPGVYETVQAFAFANTIYGLQQLRSTWFEKVGNTQSAREFVADRMKSVAIHWSLNYSTD